MTEWNDDMSAAPDGETILIAYDDGTLSMIDAEDNDYDWTPYEKVVFGARPKYWSRVTHPERTAIAEDA